MGLPSIPLRQLDVSEKQKARRTAAAPGDGVRGLSARNGTSVVVTEWGHGLVVTGGVLFVVGPRRG